jgi:hypothetical protein
MVWDNKDELSDFDLDIVGRRCVRITIPVAAVEELRTVADLLRGYAAMIDVYSRRRDMPKRVAIHAVRLETTMLNGKIREHFAALGINVRDGRPTDKERLGYNSDTARTEHTGETRVALHIGVPKPQ